ncbi:gamma-mobile-trio recombinase GmtY [Marinobacter shengliensis]|uniref:gamma-mobile-trio recombinase GmtY n=1 Tax=Marinobacter shengliensis TaxID=1389223 RepID=UPI0035B9A086
MLHSVCVEASVKIDNTGVQVVLPVIVTPDGLLRSYLDYLIVHRNKSRSWIDRSAFAVRLLIDYTRQNESCFENHYDLFREFSNCLYTGTVGEFGEDSSWLRWTPRSENDAAFLIKLITHYTDWLAEQNEDKKFQINPKVKPSGYEEWLGLAAHYQKKRRAFLSHLWANKPNPSYFRHVMPRNASRSKGTESKKSFPEGRINDLLWDGFVRYGFEASDRIYERLDLKNVLITMLMHYGGLRLSECFHLWVEDVIPWDDGTALVKVYHPAKGKFDQNSPSRREELLRQFELKPRFEYPKSHTVHAGWKDPKEDNESLHYFKVWWFPQSAGETFNDLWRLYLTYQRHSGGGKHPFAFTTRSGTPHSIKGYNQALRRAVERIGLPFSKEAGTTAHAHRHSYGQALADATADSLIIKNALHHKSIESQRVYTELTDKQMRAHLKRLSPENDQVTAVKKGITNDE